MSMVESWNCKDVSSLSPDNIIGLDLNNFVECRKCLRLCVSLCTPLNSSSALTRNRNYSVGFEMTSSRNPFAFCATPTTTSILPQFGVFNALSYMLVSDIVFVSNPPEYALDTFIPLLEAAGATCSGARCQFNYSRELFKESLGWMALGALLLLLLGISIASIMIFPNHRVLKAKRGFLGMVCKTRNSTSMTDNPRDAELPEVDQERQAVRAIVTRTGKEQEEVEDCADIKEGTEDVAEVVPVPHDESKAELPPVLMSQLCKVFPPLGGAPAKAALDNLDLHVEKGEVIGLLGKVSEVTI